MENKTHEDPPEEGASRIIEGATKGDADSSDGQDAIQRLINECDFDVPNDCPECGNALAGLVCNSCRVSGAARWSVRQLRAPLTHGAGLIEGVVSVIGLSVIGFMIKGTIGAFAGFGIGSAMAASYRRSATREADSYKAADASSLSLARYHERHTKHYDLAALCYLTWVRTHRGVRASELADAARFYLRYKAVPSMYGRLRDTLGAILFYRGCFLYLSEDRADACDIANVLAASDGDTAQHQMLTGWARAHFSEDTVTKLLRGIAPRMSEVMHGQHAGGERSADMLGNIVLFGIRPTNSTRGKTREQWWEFFACIHRIVAKAKQEGGVYWCERRRVVQITPQHIVIEAETKGTARSQTVLEWRDVNAAYTGYEGVWLCTSTHVCPVGDGKHGRLLDELVLQPRAIVSARVKPGIDWKLATWCAGGLVLLLSMDFVGLRHLSQYLSPFTGMKGFAAIMFALAWGFAHFFLAVYWLVAMFGTTRSFLRACGIADLKRI